MTKALNLAIIGGGPTGLYLANKLKDKNYNISIFEKNSWPIDKVCGQGIMPSGTQKLKNLGLHFSENESHAIRGIQYLSATKNLTGQLKNSAMGVERPTLSAKLFDALLGSQNVQVFGNTPVINLTPLEDSSIEIQLKDRTEVFDFVFCCDGMHSKSRDILGLTRKRSGDGRLGAWVHYDISPWSEYVQVYWGSGVEAYVTPVSHSRIEVAYLWYESSVGKGAKLEERLLAMFPNLSNHLLDSKKNVDFKAYGPFKKFSSRINYKNVFFLGDAYHFKDGITGEGISLGFKASDIVSENFHDFRLIHSMHIYILYLNYSFWISISLVLSRHPKLRDVILVIAGKSQKIFDTCLNLNDYSFNFLKRFY